MSGQTQAFIGVVICILALSAMHLLHYRKDKALAKRIDGIIEAARDAAKKVVDRRKRELDKQERAIHEEMAKLTVAIFQATSDMQEFIDMLRAPRFIVDLEEALYGHKAGRGGHSPGGGGAEGRAGPKNDLPDAQGEVGGGR